MSTPTTQLIQRNYGTGQMVTRIKQSLQDAGLGAGLLQWSDLTPFDQFHARGLEATKEMAEDLQLGEGQSLLDVGSGLGGPARYLAAVHGVRVTGIDLTSEVVEVSEYLSDRTGLQDRLSFRQGDATELPFPDETFDAAWTQHVAMNIENKPQLYRSIHRVLKTGGQLAINDVIKGNDQSVLYPTPWAREEKMSFVASESEMNRALAGAGFTVRSFVDKTDVAAQWFGEMQRRAQAATSPAGNPLSPLSILGDDMGQAIANFAKNVSEGRVRIVEVRAEKA